MSYNLQATVETRKFGDGGSLNLRNAPNGNLVTRIPNGSTVYVSSLSGEWLPAQFTKSGRTYTGYVMAKFIKESNVYSGSGSGQNPSGISGNGPNSTVMANDIRNGRGIWKEDTRTTHYQIEQLQKLLNDAREQWIDVPPALVCDGIYGSKTTEMVRSIQAMPWHGLDVDGIVGKNTLSVLESKYWKIAD